MKKLAVLFLVSLNLCVWAQTPSTDYTDALHLIDTWMEGQQSYLHVPGISAAIVKDQEVLWSKAYGMANLAGKTPTTTSTIYSVCSISKLFTSIAIMQLYDAGKLRLDDPIESILGEFKIKKPFVDSGLITIRSLLTHSSGLPRESDFPYWTSPDFPFPTQQQVNTRVNDQQMLYPSSTYFQYSNLGMSLLGEVVEKLSGKSYDAYVEENILKSLRLTQTHPYLPKEEWGKKMAVGYGAIRRDGTREPVALFDARGITAAAGYSSTVEDLARFASWQFRLLAKGGTELLKASTLREMHRVQWVDPDWKTTWGLGFVVAQEETTTLVSHGGSCPGYRTILQLDPKEKMAYTVMINAGGESPEMFAREFRNIISKIPKEKATLKSGVNLADFSGTYSSQPWGSETVVVPWYGDLAILSLPNADPDESMTVVRHVEGNVFKRVRSDKTLGEEIVFERDAFGSVVKMWRHSNYSVRKK